jgi:hypothetical protein
MAKIDVSKYKGQKKWINNELLLNGDTGTTRTS